MYCVTEKYVNGYQDNTAQGKQQLCKIFKYMYKDFRKDKQILHAYNASTQPGITLSLKRSQRHENNKF